MTVGELNGRLVHWMRETDRWQQARSQSFIDFDFCGGAPRRLPTDTPLDGRDLLDEIQCLSHLAESHVDGKFRRRTRAFETYMRRQLGEAIEFDRYLAAVQGTVRTRIDSKDVSKVVEDARSAIKAAGLTWDANTAAEVHHRHGEVKSAEVADCVRSYLRQVKPWVEAWLERDLPIHVEVLHTDVDEYWSYWVGGNERSVSMRINTRWGELSRGDIALALIHEVICHCGQLASWRSRVEEGRQLATSNLITSINSPEQFALEGLAQTFLLFVPSIKECVGAIVDPQLLEADLVLYYARELAVQEMFDAISSGTSDADALAAAQNRCPWLSDESLRTNLATLRHQESGAYRYVYPLSFRTFVEAAREAGSEKKRRVLVQSLFDDVWYLGETDDRKRWFNRVS